MKYICFLAAFILFTTAIQAQDSTAAQLAGKYKFPDGSVIAEVTVVYENGSLMMNASVGSSVLEKEAEDVYNIVAFQGKAVFKRDANKKVIGVSINAMGYQLEGTKEQPTFQWHFSKQQPQNGYLAFINSNFNK